MAYKVLRPTGGKEWRAPREEGYVKQLPSGNVARLRPVTPDQLLTTGEVPDILTPLVVRMLFEGADGSELTQLTDPQKLVENAGATVVLFNTICRLAFVEPRIVANPQGDDEISIDDVPLLDRSFVFSLCTQPAEVLRDFMFPAATTVETLPDGQGDGQPTERPDDDSGSLGGAPV